MPGTKITDHQVSKYKAERKRATQEIAAAKTGISVRSARRIEQSTGMPSQRGERVWRTRTDPLAGVWDEEVVPLLESEPGLLGTTLFEELQRRHPERFEPGVVRTLQRRVRAWRAVSGGERETYFAQAHPPGRFALSDFTVADELNVSIAGMAFPHRLYQFALAYSGWRYAEIVHGGESYMALASGLQNALWAIGGVTEEHRTDSLSAAFNNLAEEEQLTTRYAALCLHYGMRASRNNLGVSHENGAIESRQGSLKVALAQALLLRGHRDFETEPDYRRFLAEIVARLNHRVRHKIAEERPRLLPLPARRTSEFEEVDARVTKFGTFTVKRILYSTHSRLIGHRLKVRLYADRIEGWLGGTRVMEAPRGRLAAGQRRGKVIDYRHLLPALRRKPGAFARWVLRDEMFPRDEYRRTWERLQEGLSERQACKTMVGLLDLAARGACEADLAQVLAGLLQAGTLPDLPGLEERFAPRVAELPEVKVELPTLADYDTLLQGAA